LDIILKWKACLYRCHWQRSACSNRNESCRGSL